MCLDQAKVLKERISVSFGFTGSLILVPPPPRLGGRGP